ncbi:MAG: sigma-70 family RNA polymerase sigma factor [Anaerolineae bacterium]|nr:sigma-70 family RNA polymerase sigma factor [Anaerolineae bacterium]
MVCERIEQGAGMAGEPNAVIILPDRKSIRNMNQASVPSLLKQILSGDEAALLALHDRFSNVVYSVAYRVLNNQQDAEEVTQDVFLRLWDKAASFDPNKGKFLSWLLTITRRMAIDLLRKRSRREPPPNSISMDEKPHLWETMLVVEDLDDLQRTLLSTLDELPQGQQQAIQLAYFYGMSHTDISEYLKRPLGTVKSQIRLGMQKLRTIWLSKQPMRSESDSER